VGALSVGGPILGPPVPVGHASAGGSWPADVTPQQVAWIVDTTTPRALAHRTARTPSFTEKSLRGFDFKANPSIDPAVVHTLAKCEWVKKGQPLCLIGDPGTGKSHLLIALGTEAAISGFRVKYTLATKLANKLVEAADEKTLSKTIARYGRVVLLCIDELGHMQLDRRGAELLF